jgi:hypothetical protein
MTPEAAPVSAAQQLARATLLRRLGHAGLLPFLAGALLVWVLDDPTARAASARGLAAYGALIASFLGGVHWGSAMRQPAPPPVWLAWGVTPSLLAWPALVLPPGPGLVLLAAVLLLCWAVDRRLYPAQGLARWLTLRLQLSAVAAACCAAGAAGAWGS